MKFINISNITLEEANDMFRNARMVFIVRDGKLKGFKKEKY